MKYRIGVMGSASGSPIRVQETITKSVMVGQEIARADCILVNGACRGLPDEAAFGAKNAGGMTMGISPAFSLKEHTEKYKSPDDNLDIIVFTGLGLMERDLINIRSSDAIIVLGGGVGTLNEFTVAFDEEKVVGVLTGTGGVSDHIPEILSICGHEVEDFGFVLFDSDPKALVQKVVERLKTVGSSVTKDQRVFRSFMENKKT